MKTAVALRIRVDGIVHPEEYDEESIDMLDPHGWYVLAKETVGGYVEKVNLPDSQLVMWVNEDGLPMGLPVNRFATDWATVERPGRTTIVGDVLITGLPNGDRITGLTHEEKSRILSENHLWRGER